MTTLPIAGLPIKEDYIVLILFLSKKWIIHSFFKATYLKCTGQCIRGGCCRCSPVNQNVNQPLDNLMSSRLHQHLLYTDHHDVKFVNTPSRAKFSNQLLLFKIFRVVQHVVKISEIHKWSVLASGQIYSDLICIYTTFHIPRQLAFSVKTAYKSKATLPVIER